MRLAGKIVIGIIGGLVVIVLSVILAFAVSPYPTGSLLKVLFANPNYERVDDFDTNHFDRVEQVAKDISYESKHGGDPKLDVFAPKEYTGTLPVIIWIHGGAFVAGDKLDNQDYMIMLASRGYLVVNANYSLAPKHKYPTPILQIGEVYQYVIDNAQKYNADINSFYFGGDSAGAHMVSQFVNIQVDTNYQQLVSEVPPVIQDVSTIKGVILFCGPYDLDNLESFGVPDFFIKRVGWGYLGKKNWSELAKPLDMLKNISENFPPVLITDGAKNSFLPHAKALGIKLRELKGLAEDDQSIVREIYHENLKLSHEYQFNVGKYEEALLVYNKVIEFIIEFA